MINNDLFRGLHGGVVVSTVASQWAGSRFDSQLRPFCVEFACSPRVCVGSLLPLSKNMHVRLIGDSKLSLGVSVCGCLSRLWPCDGLATCPGCTPPLARWPCDPTDGLSGYRKWIDLFRECLYSNSTCFSAASDKTSLQSLYIQAESLLYCVLASGVTLAIVWLWTGCSII